MDQGQLRATRRDGGGAAWAHDLCVDDQPNRRARSPRRRPRRPIHDLPNVKAGYRFYAGAPLLTPDGYALGTVCVVDLGPRGLTMEQTDGLRRLARQAVEHLEQRRQIIRLRSAHEELAAELMQLRSSRKLLAD